jgi:phosphate-selective porin OprO/OprP
MHRPLAVSALALALASIVVPAHAADPTNAELLARIVALEQRIATLEGNGTPATAAATDVDQRLRVVERQQELQAEADAAKVASTPTVSLGEKGLSVKSADSAFEVKVRGLVQGDGRMWFGDDDFPQDDTFLLRRVEPTLEGTWGSLVGFRLNAQFAGDSATINDAYVDLKFDPRATLRIGKTKTPVGLERLQSSASTEAIELGFPSELAPGRDVGLQLQGEFASGTSYALGVYNGAPDGRDGATTNPDNDFEVAGRVFFDPWKNDANALSGLGFGIAASRGEKHGNGNSFLPRYRTPGQVQVFGYLGDVFADGEQTRVSPQAYYYNGRFGLLGEYIVSRQEVSAPARAIEATTLGNRAWQLLGGVVLTGEDASYRGVAKPAHPFTLGGPGWGAFELVARYGRLSIDDDAFPLFADPAKSVSAESGWGLGLNWYLTSNFKLVANYTQTSFDAALGAAPREDEKAFFTRAQFSF